MSLDELKQIEIMSKDEIKNMDKDKLLVYIISEFAESIGISIINSHNIQKLIRDIKEQSN